MSIKVEASYDKWGFRHVHIAAREVETETTQENQKNSLSQEEDSDGFEIIANTSDDDEFEIIATSSDFAHLPVSSINLQQTKSSAYSSWNLSNMWQQHTTPQGIYEEVMRSASAPGILGAKESQFWHYMHKHFSSHGDLPTEGVNELKQAAIWAEALETSQTDPETAHNKIENLATEISKAIKQLSLGYGCIIPAGPFVILRINYRSFQQDKGYDLEFFSRNPTLQGNAFAVIGGRKRLSGHHFCGLPLSQVSDVYWLQLLLGVCLKGVTSLEAFNHFLAPLKKYLIKTNTFHLTKRDICRIQNLWDLFNEKLCPYSSAKNRSLRKLELMLEVLFGYFNQQKASLRYDSTAFVYLKEGMLRTDREILMAASLNFLTSDEVASMHKELQHIQNQLDTIQTNAFVCQPVTTLKNTSMALTVKLPQLHNPYAPPPSHEQRLSSSDHLSSHVAIKKVQSGNFESYRLKTPMVSLPPLNPIDALKELNTLLEETNVSPDSRCRKAVEKIFNLPLDPTIKECPWLQLSEPSRLQASIFLADIATLLKESIDQEGILLPDRFLALVKITTLTEYLARLNATTTSLHRYRLNPDLLAIIAELCKGSAPSCNGSFLHKRCLLNKSVYRVHYPEEKNVLDELSAYCLWHLPEEFDCYREDFKEGAEYSGWRGSSRGREFSFGTDSKLFKCSEIEVNFSLAPYKNNVQCQHLHQMIVSLRSLLQLEESEGVHLDAFLDIWGKPIEHPILQALAYAFRVEEGNLSLFVDNANTFTPEAIRDDPWTAVERAYKCWQTEIHPSNPLKKLAFAEAKSSHLNDISDKELQSLLLSCSPKTALWSILGLLNQNILMFSNIAIQGFVEHLVLQKDVLEHAFLNDTNELGKYLSECFQQHIQKLERIGEIPTAIFLVQLYRSISLALSDHSVLLSQAPDFTMSLKRWLEKATPSNSQLHIYCHAILGELVYSLRQRESLNHRELEEYILLKSKWESTFPLVGYDLTFADEILKQYDCWQHIIKANIDIPVHLDSVAEIKRRSTGSWEEIFPISNHMPSHSMPPNHASKSLDAKRTTVPLPQNILRHYTFCEAVPHMDKRSYSAQVYRHEGSIYYQFQDCEGYDHLIESKDGSLAIYKKCDRTENSWVQFVPITQLEGHRKNTLWHNLRLFLPTDSSKKAFFFNLQGEAEFEAQLAYAPGGETLTISSLKNLNFSRDLSSDYQAVLFDPEQHSDLNPLLALASASEILLWYEHKTLRIVEIYGGEAFILRNNQLQCLKEPHKGYYIDFTATARIGLPIGVILQSPDLEPKKTILLLPRFNGEFVLDKNKPAFLSQASEMLSSYWSGKTLAVEWAGQDHHVWQFDYRREPEWWRMEINLPEYTIHSPEANVNYHCYFDLFKFCLHTMKVRGNTCVFMARECLKKLSSLAPHKISKEALEKFIIEIADIATSEQHQHSMPSEVVALTLRCLLLLQEVSGLALQIAIEKQIVSIAISYFGYGRQMDIAAKLSNEEETSCLLLIEKHNPLWFMKNAPLLCPIPNNLIQAPLKERDWQLISKEQFICPSALKLYHKHVRKYLIQDMGSKAENTPESILPGFRLFYCIAGSGSERQKSESFIESFNRIKCASAKFLREQDNPESEKARLTGEYVKRHASGFEMGTRYGAEDLDLLLEYLEAIFDIKIAQPTLTLPPLPNKEGDIDNFCDLLTLWVQQHYPRRHVKVPTHITKEEINPLFHAIAEKAIMEKKSTLTGLPLDMLESRVNSSHPQAKIVIKIHDQGPALVFPKEQLAEYFKSWLQPYSFAMLKLEKLRSKNDRVLHHTLDLLIEEIDLLQIGQRQMHEIKSAEKLRELNQKLEMRITQLSLIASQKRTELAELLAPKALTLIEQLEKRAGYSLPLSWDELVIAFLQQDFHYISTKLPEGTSLTILKKKLMEYFKCETEIRFIEYIKSEMQDLLTEHSLSQYKNSAAQLFRLLSRPRCYDPEQHPELLAMEYLLGYMLRPDQLQLVSDFINNSNAIRCAPTGSGKTSVILRLTALLKANGSNLVTLKFLNSQFHSNCDAFYKLLGSDLKSKVATLLFSADMSLICEQHINGRRETISLFQKFYEDLLKVIIQKGCVLTNKKTQPLLKAKMIDIYYRLSQFPQNERPSIDLSHLHWLGKLLCLFKEREETIYDEFDKFLTPLEEFHFRISEGKPLPSYIAETILEVYDLILSSPNINFKSNAMGETSPDNKQKILSEIAAKVAKQWHTDKGMPTAENAFVNYLLGRSSLSEENGFLEVIERHPNLTPRDLDKLALQKDLLSRILKVTLFKAADHHYICSHQDGKSVIPCEYADVPKEGSEFDDVRVKLCYLIQYYYQKGISIRYFSEWVNDLKSQAVEKIIRGEATCFADTVAEKYFKNHFPASSLEKMEPTTIKLLYNEFAKSKDTRLLRKFLSIRTEEQKLPGRKISFSPHNDVSIAKSASGTSATKGCIEGLHRHFDVQEHIDLEQKRSSNALMILRMLERIEQPFIYFNQSDPESIIKDLLQADPSLKVVIDGAGALRGMDPSLPAEILLAKSDLNGIVYFDTQGKLQALGTDSKAKGVVFSHAQSRGADVKNIPLNYKAVLLANGRTGQEEVTQNEGRLRREDQKMRVALPLGSSINNPGDWINANIEVQAQEYSINLLLSKQQELQDVVHSDMIDKLAQFAAENQLDEGFTAFGLFQEKLKLVSEFEEDWDTPGAYYAAHRKIVRSKDGVDQLNEAKENFLVIAKNCNLSPTTLDFLQQYNAEKYRALLPTNFDTQDLNREVLVETETHTEVTVEAYLNTHTIVHKPKVPFYLPWNWHRSISKEESSLYSSVQSAYHQALRFSPNFMPLYRNVKAPKVHHREPHDQRQHRLHYIALNGSQAESLDVLDADKELKFAHRAIYDSHCRRYIVKQKIAPEDQFIYNILALQKRTDHCLWLAQMRFEDGQYDGYSKDEWQALRSWIKQSANRQALEEYFCHEILKHRPQERASYVFSPLYSLFREL